jgi:uncharacterized protein
MLDAYRDQLRRLCEAHRVHRLELFGSAVRGGGFDPDASDYDFFVEFADDAQPSGSHAGGKQPAAGAFKRYMGLKFGLEELLGRPVDLVEIGAVTNPYFLRHTASSRVEVFRAA